VTDSSADAATSKASDPTKVRSITHELSRENKPDSPLSWSFGASRKRIRPVRDLASVAAPACIDDKLVV
jgi:hypothetical protein